MQTFSTKIAFLYFLFFTQVVMSQTFADKDYYLVDSLNLSKLTSDDSLLLDTSLKSYHDAKNDTSKVNAIGEICAKMMDDAWVKYQFFQYSEIEKALEKTPSDIENKILLKSKANALSNYGYIYQNLGEISKALVYYEKAIKIQETLGDESGASNTMSNIGTIYDSRGDIPKALEYYNQSLEIRKRLGNKKNLAGSYNNIGSVYMAQGDIDKALGYFLDALKMFEEVGNKRGISYVVNNIGGIYNKQGNRIKAIVYYEKGLKIRKELGDRAGIANSLNNLASMNRLQKKFVQSIAYYKESLKIFEEVGNKTGIAFSTYNIGLLYNDLGETSNAYEYTKRSYDLSNELGFPKNQKKAANVMKYISIVQAKKFEKSNRANLATNKFNQADSFALKVIEINNKAILSNFSVLSEKSQEKYFRTVAPNYMSFNSYALMRKENNPEIVNVVYNNIIKNKGLLLKSSTAMHNAVFNSGDSVLIDNYTEWIDLKKKIAKLYSKGKNTKRLDQEANEYEKELVKSSQLFSEFSKLQNISWKDVQKGLKHGEVAIEFVDFKFIDYKSDSFDNYSDTVLYCALVVTPTCTTPEMIPLFYESELEAILGKFGGNNFNYINEVYGGKTKANTKLYHLIWKPLESILTNAVNVFVSPSGLLHKISFSAIAKEQGVYLCDDYNVEIKSSTGKITENTSSSFRDDENQSVATVFGGITYDTDSTETQIWSYLTGTKTETEKINKILDKKGVKVNYFSNVSATEEEFKLMASNSNVLHIATHGFFYPDPKEVKKEIEEHVETGDVNFRGGSRGFGVGSFVENPNPLMRSGLVFAGANDVWSKQNEDNTDDGVLTAQEVAHIDMRKTKLVVLSACETGLGDIKGSEGVYGLQRSFKMAGVKFIIMSLWQVPDKETAEFMAIFYENLTKSNDIKKAFSKTQQLMRKKYDPYYWAAFVLVE